ncbi:hypothetical protein G6F24_015780 [Rhizopus arrhizus]|nr:hypothetical protein G6F24_015780 [Rhizopus arrhizus]
MEFLEYHRLLLGCDAGPGVVHTDGQALAVATHAQQNAAVAGVADGIGQEVLQHAAQQQRIAMHPGVGAQVPELQAARRCQYRKFLRQRSSVSPGVQAMVMARLRICEATQSSGVSSSRISTRHPARLPCSRPTTPASAASSARATELEQLRWVRL